MDKFEASNGRVIGKSVDHLQHVSIYFGADGTGGTFVMTAAEYAALREFFRAERDAELGRWRRSENPDYVVYPDDDGAGVIVWNEHTPSWGSYSRGLCEGTSAPLDGGAHSAAHAYFEAHPERKPWHAAKEGEVWIVTPSKALTLGEKTEYPAIFQAGMFRDHGGSWGAEDLTAARRIWPESSDD